MAGQPKFHGRTKYRLIAVTLSLILVYRLFHGELTHRIAENERQLAESRIFITNSIPFAKEYQYTRRRDDCRCHDSEKGGEINMKIIALDDEELALEGLMDAIRKAAPDAELEGFSYAEDVLEFIKDHTCDVAFLDVEMVGLNGVALAEQLKICNPDINIIFATGFSCYREAAFDLHASGYLMKPITEAKVKKELENLRRPVPKQRRIRVRCFGNFEVWLDGAPMKFKYD